MASVAAPHRLAEESGLRVLAQGGNAVDACIAMAASLCALYPHMTGLGGDGFWLVADGRGKPRAVQACGPAALAADPAFFLSRGLSAVPPRGPLAAVTVPGAVAGWDLARRISADWPGRQSLDRLFADARRLADGGSPVSRSQAALCARHAAELSAQPGFGTQFMPGGRAPRAGETQRQPRLADLLRRLAAEGLDSFYRGSVADDLAADFAELGSPLAAADLRGYRAAEVDPVALELSIGTVYNLPPPSQGVAALAILGIAERLGPLSADTAAGIHNLVEATKLAFAWRDRSIGTLPIGRDALDEFLSPASLDALAARVDPDRAAPWPAAADAGDTVWFGAADDAGRVCSVIQSIYWEFGSGVVLPRCGILAQNRGQAFSVDPGPRRIAPGAFPFHTLNPALAVLRDGRTVAYGSMGGDGQAQTQAALLARFAWSGFDPAAAVGAPRWLLGRTWGEDSAALRLESRFPPEVAAGLAERGHPVVAVGDYEDAMGHAGMVVWQPNLPSRAAHDPRGDGAGADRPAAVDGAAARMHRTVAGLASFGEDGGGCTRLLYDGAWRSARAWLAELWGSWGLRVDGDRVGNLYGRVAGRDPALPPVLCGSHLDTVRRGGALDGAYGVAAAGAALAALVERHGPPARAVEAVAFAEEEGSRFPLAYWGSGNLAGLWDAGAPPDLRDADGLSLADAMAQAGFGQAGQADPRRGAVACYLELHIEQGLVLERAGLPIGVVQAIVGQRRLGVRLAGQANHAGTTPMEFRRDALAGAAEMIALVERSALAAGRGLVATVGRIEASPNTGNVVAGAASFSLDLRHSDNGFLADYAARLEAELRAVARRRGLDIAIEPALSVDAAPMDSGLGGVIRDCCRQRGLAWLDLPSGAGHDAQVMSRICPSAMVFVPSTAGVSHSPYEHSSVADLDNGLAVLGDALYQLAWKGALP